MQIRVIAEVLSELTGDSMNVEAEFSIDDFDGEMPSDVDVIQALMDTISIVPLKIVRED